MGALIARLKGIGALSWLMVGAILALLFCLALMVGCDRQDDGQAVATVQADRAADAAAATRRRSDDARLAEEAAALERITENEADPVAARRAYLVCVRLQQQARAAGNLTPAC
jgi:hypothetical protein